jgi:cobalt-zinc-cadmium efflux system membrane fusion protein
MNKSIIQNSIPLFSSLALLLTVFSCNKPEATDDMRTPYVIPDSLMKTLIVDTVKTSNIKDAIKFNGLVDFNTDKVVNVFPLISGNVQGITVVPGDFVKAGQVLGVVKSAEVANYNSALITASTNVQLTAKQRSCFAGRHHQRTGCL